MRLYLFAVALFVCVGAAQAVYVYQETATSGNSYGLKNNGTYNVVLETGVSWYLYVNYSKPTTAYTNGSLWQIKIGENPTSPYNGTIPISNITLPTSCLSSSVVQLRFYSIAQAFTGSSQGECLNSTSSWVTVSNVFSRTNSTAGITTGQFYNYPSQYSYWYDGVWDDFGNVNYNPAASLYIMYSKGPAYPYHAASIMEEAVYWYFNNTLNMSFYDENGTYLSGTSVTYYITNGLNTFSGTTSTGSVRVSDLYEDNYTVTYSASGYEQREMIVSVDQINDSATLYLLQSASSTNVLVTIYDTLTDRVENASVFVQKKNLSGTNYYTVESCYTDALGECLMRLDLFDTTYRFVIYYGGEFKLNSGDTQLFGETKSFIINRQSFSITDLFKLNSILGNVSANSTTFTFNYSDTYRITSGGCLELSRRDGSSITVVSSNCSTEYSNSLVLTYSNSTGDEWIGRGYVIYNGMQYDIATNTFITSSFKARFGSVGLFYFGFLLIGTMVFSALYSIVAALVMAGVGVWIMNSLGFINIGTSAVASLIIIIVIYIITVKRT